MNSAAGEGPLRAFVSCNDSFGGTLARSRLSRRRASQFPLVSDPPPSDRHAFVDLHA
jgi:hypothetical protein